MIFMEAYLRKIITVLHKKYEIWTVFDKILTKSHKKYEFWSIFIKILTKS